MKKQELQKIIREEVKKVLSEKINFALGTTVDGDPDKPLKDSFYIQFKQPQKAILKLTKLASELKAQELGDLNFKNMGIVITNPTQNQMNAILKAFNDSDIDGMGRVLK